MSRRIKTPIDRNAFDQAEAEFQHKYAAELVHPDAQTPGTKRHRKLRDKWLDLYKRHGGQVDSGKTFQDRLPGDVAEPCPLKNEIAEVGFLDGDDVTLAAGTVQQHVNLPRQAKFVDGGHVTNIDRLGRKLRVFVRFTRAKKEAFKVELLSHRKNAIYSGAEKRNRPSFNYTRPHTDHPVGHYLRHHGAIYTGTTGGDGTAIIDGVFEVTPAGGDRYMLVAYDVNGKVVQSAAIVETRRTIYYMTALADDPNNVIMDQAWFRGRIEAKYRPRGIDLVFLGEEDLPGLVYADIDNQLQAGDRVLAATANNNGAYGRPYDDYKPYLICFAFVDHVANARKKVFDPVAIPNVAPNSVIDIPVFIQPALTRANDPHFDWRKALWIGLGPAQYDRTTTGSEWFERGTLTVHAVGGDVVVALAEGDLTPVGRSALEPDALCELQLDVTGHFAAPTAVTVEIEGVIMYQSVMGSTLTGRHKGIALQPARTQYVLIPRKKRLASAIHEAGHALGMVAGTATQGLQHGTYYEYNGQHCHHAIAAQANPIDYHRPPHKDTGTCIMYGLIPDAAPNLNFCPGCRRVLRRIDLGNGLYLD